MAVFKSTWAFQQDNAGWSESLFIESGNISDAYDEALALGKLRAQLLGWRDRVKIKFIRVSRLAGGGPSLVRVVNLVSDRNIAQDMPDMPWIGVQTTMVSSNGRRRGLILRGVPDYITLPTPDKPALVGDWANEYRAWRNRIVNRQWRMKVIVKAFSPLVTITSMETDILGGLIVTSPAHGLATGAAITWYRVDVSGVCLRGRHTIVKIDDDSFKVTDYNVMEITFRQGSYRTPSYSYLAITSMVLGGKKRHKPGRPFGLLVGRRKKCKH